MRAEHKRKRSGIVIAVILLLVCEMASLSALCSRVIGYTQAKFYNLVSITGDLIETEMEIFHLSYDETGKMTVYGGTDNSDKLIAPGTSNAFEFTVHNPLENTVDYIMTMEAVVDGTDIRLPVNARVWDYTNRYLLGSSDEMAEVMELNTVEDAAALGADKYAPYTLEWEWPFEWGGDEYDTVLGNLAVDDDISLTVVIRIVAEYDESDDTDPPGLDGPPDTGDDSQLWLFLLIAAVSLLGIILLLFFGRRKDDDSEQEKK